VHGGLDRLCDGVGNVVELQVEKNAEPLVGECADERGPLEREEPAADLDSADEAAKLRRELARARAGVDVEGD
jgi:hypothetical protein